MKIQFLLHGFGLEPPYVGSYCLNAPAIRIKGLLVLLFV